ncbi:MAG: DUF484 family protein [Immundisolibacteraceae bacterium]|nr:DUF484 family protein [Immundisolibacteraceae bacterium]
MSDTHTDKNQTVVIQTELAEQIELDDAAVAKFLSNDSGFFLRQPDLLAELTIPHTTRGAVSLVEKQLDLLRDRNQQLQDKLQQLINNADANQATYDRIGSLAIGLARAGSLDSLLQELCDQMADNFAVDAVAIELAPRQQGEWPPQVHTPDESGAEPLIQPYLGAPPADINLPSLFGNHAGQIASVAILPLGEASELGRLLLASNDADRFRADLGTQLLSQIGELLSVLLDHHR